MTKSLVSNESHFVLTRGEADMNKVQVSFLAELRSITGRKSTETMVEEGATVRTLLSILSEEFGENFRTAVFDSEGELRRNIIIRHNGENIAVKNGLETLVEKEDVIAIMSAVAGG